MRGMKGPMLQIFIGLCFSSAALSGIYARSWDAARLPFYVGLFFVAVGLAGDARRSDHRIVRIGGRLLVAGCAVLFVGAALTTAERLYLVNGSHYPRVLAKDIGAADAATVDSLHKGQCKGELVEIYGKDDGQWVIRCGFSWVGGHTFVSSSEPFSNDVRGASR